MRTGDTIAALATTPAAAPGASHALIRISGPGAHAAVGSLCDGAPQLARSIGRVFLRLGTRTLPAWLFNFPAGSSYTGESTVELVVPANRSLVARVLDHLYAQPGVRPAEPGEFSARAYLAGRLSLVQAEGIASLIAAQNDAQWLAATQLAQGRAGETHRAWADEIARLLALTEAGIDFTDQEDVVAISPVDLAERLRSLQDQIAAAAPSVVRTGAVRVALVGPPNAGKSTLFNALLGRERSLTADRAGTTRDAIVEPLDLSPLSPARVDLIDLPGLDAEGLDPIGIAAQAQARSVLDSAEILIRCAADQTGWPTPGERDLIVRTKADRPHPNPPNGVIEVCAIDGYGLAALRVAIAHRADELAFTASASAAGIAPRHAAALRQVAMHLQCAHERCDPEADRVDDPELIASDLRGALDAMAPLVGRIEPDEVLGLVFGSFCVGK